MHDDSAVLLSPDRVADTGWRIVGMHYSQGAARALGFVRAGRARVRIEVLRWGQ